jgi:hypothetical protein
MKKLNISKWLGNSKLKWFVGIYVVSALAYGIAITLSHVFVEWLK